MNLNNEQITELRERTDNLVIALTEKIRLLKELEKSILYENADFVVRRTTDYPKQMYRLADKGDKFVNSGTMEDIQKWMKETNLNNSAVYFHQ